MISVVIPSYNSEKTISSCLGSLQNQSYADNYEIILIDSSTDNTPWIVSKRHPDVKYTHLSRKTDPGTARNMGVGIAKGELIAFVDSDCTVAYDWLEKIALAHKSFIGVVGGAVHNGNHEKDVIALAGYLSEFRDFLPGGFPREVFHIPTCNISYKRAIFDKHGVFNGRYYPQEDLVFNYHLQKNGERILLDPKICVYHQHRSRLIDFLKHQRRIGTITSTVLKKFDLEGAFIVRKPCLGIFLVPLLPVIKFVRTLNVFFRCRPELIIKRPAVLIYFGIGLLFWTWGFAKGAYGKTIP